MFRVFGSRPSCLSRCPSRGCFVKRLTARAYGALRLPQRGSAVVAERIERADIGERHDLVAAESGAREEMVEGAEALGDRPGPPFVRARVADPAMRIDLLEHACIVTSTFGTVLGAGGWGPGAGDSKLGI